MSSVDLLGWTLHENIDQYVQTQLSLCIPQTLI